MQTQDGGGLGGVAHDFIGTAVISRKIKKELVNVNENGRDKLTMQCSHSLDLREFS